MRVLFDGLPLGVARSGIRTRILALARELPGLGIETGVLVAGRGNPPLPGDIREVEAGLCGRGLLRLRLPRILRRAEREFPFDAFVADALPWPPRIPLVGVVHDLRGLAAGGPLRRALYGGALAAGVRGALRLHAVSASTAGELEAWMRRRGIRRMPPAIVRNGVDREIYNPEPHPGDASILARRGISGRYLLWAGHLEERKNPGLAVAVRAFELDAGIAPDRPLVMAGTGPLHPEPEFAALARRHPGCVAGIVLRDCDETSLAALYRHATATIATSRLEGFGMVPLESLACGTPVVASDLPAHREVLGDCAAYVGCGAGPAEWAQAIGEAERRRLAGVEAAVQARLSALTWRAAAEAFAADLAGLQRGRSTGC